MRTYSSRWPLILSLLAILLLLVTSLAAIVLDDGGQPYSTVSLRGEHVEIYGGQGLYRYDNVTKAVLFRGFDWANLFVAVPLFFLGIGLYRKGQFRGRILLAALFTYLAYNYLIGVMGNAFNVLFLLWTALFSLGLFGLAVLLPELEIASFPEKLAENFPRRSLAIYAIVLGLFLLFQYLNEILTAYGSSAPPASLDIYTTLELAALELGIMVPLHLAGAVLLWKKKALGYFMVILLAFTAMMTFISLSLAMLMMRFGMGRGSLPDVAIPVILAVIATGFSIVISRRVIGK